MVRREWGSGSCYQTKAGRWRVAVSLGRDPFGKRIRKEWQRSSEKGARAKLAEVARRLDRGLPVEEARVTLAAYGPTWLASIASSVKPSTFAFYRTLLEVHLTESDFGPLRVARITPATVRALIGRMQSEGYRPRTIRGVLDVLRQVLRQAMADGIVDRNVVELVRRPRLEQAEPRHLTADQARRFLDAARADPLYSLFAVALGTGLRRGELLALTWRDVDLEAGTINVRAAKTAAGVRRIPLAPFAAAALAELEHAPGPIWLVSPTSATKRAAKIATSIGVEGMTLHSLRHSTASLLLDAGVDPLTIQSILGHTRVSMTAWYARAGDEARREAMAKLGRAVG